MSEWVELYKQEELSLDSKKMTRRVYENAVTANQFKQIDADMDLQWNEEELIAFHELRIMYAMKDLEINIKRILRYGFPHTPIKTIFKWDALAEFLKAQGIEIKIVNAYIEIDQLRQVNNYIKHAAGPNKSIQHINEFKNMEYPSSDAFNGFYERIQKAPETFLHSLLSVIYEHLYKFDDKRIDRMAKELVLRMDSKTARRFIQQLSAHYLFKPDRGRK